LLHLQGSQLRARTAEVKPDEETTPAHTSTEVEKALSALQAQMEQLKQDKTAVGGAEVAQKDERQRELLEEIESLKATLVSTQSKEGALEGELETARNLAAGREKEFKKVLREKMDGDKMLKDLESTKEKFEVELAGLTEQLVGREEDLEAAQKKEEAAQLQIIDLQKNINDLETKVQARIKTIKKRERDRAKNDKRKDVKRFKDDTKVALQLAKAEATIEKQKALEEQQADALKVQRELEKKLERQADEHAKKLQETIDHQRRDKARQDMLKYFSEQRV
jgi:hypothetical protein